MRAGRYTADELRILTERFPHESVKTIAADLDRGVAGVATKAHELGLKKSNAPRPWTQDELDEIRRRYADDRAEDIADDLGRNLSTVYYQAKQMNLEKAPDFLRRMAQRPRAPRSDAWTKRQREDLRRLYPYERTAEVAALIGRTPEATNSMAFKMGVQKSAEYMVEQNARLCAGGKAHRIQPGNVPANKGMRRPGWHRGRMRETQFKKGHVSANLQQIGELRYAKKDGTWWIKISMDAMPVQRRWLEVHKLVWMREHGDIPPKHVVRFIEAKPEDPADITAELLECISLAENCRRNSIHRYPKPVADAMRARGILTREINKQERKHGRQRQRK